ncbi:HlyD family secretion protein [Chryseosolibacter indicus]|uniref:HlyD family efflux transporter periplasmic adaptor subunit n=1 Tax=Chryseosolibacter indicus TaxID=2782351 RepID=A0ABS5VWZ7_9BACT|nr:HlyD family efflux transporter periplasmic adaptor subunit [Chryseosolibacter indicus]MBT1705761.1 HlyD family efflux transporter periplasmic adaptor subunit [Chryseosolibacter indicus]
MLNLSTQSISRSIKAENLYSLRALKTPPAGILLAKWLMVIGLILVLFLLLPWQQNIRGTGRVTALSPAHRPQTVQAVIAGQIQQWHVREGEYVNTGDTIVTIREVKEKYFDPEFLTRLKEQLESKKSSLNSKSEKAQALKRQIAALRNGMSTKIEQATAKLEAEKVKFENAKNQYERNKHLYDAGNIPLTKFQDIEYKYQGSMADFQNAQVEIGRLRAEYQEKISKSESDLNATEAEVFEAEVEISKLTNEYANMQIRAGQYQIIAPQDGYIVRAMKAGIGETIKEGDAVCTVMPEVNDLAVEMYVKAMDIPLISKGRKVRVEFDGWPALQFSGWPSVSVGSFGGIVEVIDYVSSEPGEFRILVTPDKSDEPWPQQLRVGSGTRGWVMLDNVPVWYEIWRQINGFPPSLYKAPLKDAVKDKGNKDVPNQK